ncbi:MAG TPA: hypothetical protein VEL07_05050 [Planctomycetota bacterium]|nr:hypothetical protein [Planctomycetota bacterium]
MRSLVIAALIGSLAAEDGTLRSAAAETRAPDGEGGSARPADDDDEHRRHAHPHHDGHDGDDLVGDLTSAMFCSTLGSGDGHWRGSYALPRHPYAGDYAGWLVWEPGDADLASIHEPATAPPTRWWALRLSVDAARIEEDLGRGGVELRALLPWRIELAGHGDWYRERVGGDDVDLRIGGVDAAWRAVQFANCALRIGGGARWLDDELGSESGGVFAIGLDVFPIEPLFVAAGYAVGRLGNADLVEATAEAGVLIGPAEVAIGYESRRIGDVDLEGPYLALRWWF